MQSKLFHHAYANLPSIPILPPSSPYLAVKTIYHKQPFSPFNLQHHLPNNDTLNSLILLTHKLSSSFLGQITSQIIQDVFPESSLPQKKTIENNFKESNDTCRSIEEGNEVNHERKQTIL
jgi:hypothetical protein